MIFKVNMKEPHQNSSDQGRRNNVSKPRLKNLPDGPAVSPELFLKFQSLIYRESGIWLGSHKTALLTGRLSKRLRMLECGDFHDYYKIVSQPDRQAERTLMIDCIATNETHFFREQRHFDYLSQKLFPEWKKQASAGEREKRVHIWSAGCSTGEEPYSIAMLALKHFPEESGWDVRVFGSDISTKVLDKASVGLFPIEKSGSIPAEFLQAFMLRGVADQHGWMKVGPAVRSIVKFSQINLHSDSYPISGSFDLVFCRNVLIYFDKSSKDIVLHGLLRHLAPSGRLFIGHAETLNGCSTKLKTVIPTVYARVDGVSK